MRILVAQTAYLGDAVLTTPLLRALKQGLPDSHITLLCRPAAITLLEGLPFVDAFLADRKKETGSIPSAFALRNPIRQGKFDAAVAAHRSPRTAILLACSGAPIRVGFEKSALGIVYHRQVPDLRHEGIPAARRYLELLRGFGLDPETFDASPEVPVQAEALERMRALLKHEGWKEGQAIALLCHGSEWETKKWTAEGYAALAARLASEKNMTVVLTADRSEMKRGDDMAVRIGAPVINLTGRSSLKELTALISLSSLVVANDSAPAHIASALKRPQVTIFGPTHSRQGFAPQQAAARVAEHPDLYCRPCGRHGAKRCPEVHFRCMRELDADSVFAKAEEALAAAQ